MGKIDHRSMGHLKPEVTRLRSRLKSGIAPALCWGALVDEAGSELVERTIQMFWDSISVGGQAAQVGNAAAFFSSRIAFLRANRQMVATTFQYLTLPLHVALVGLLLFVMEIMGLFTKAVEVSSGALDGTSAMLSDSGIGSPELFSFGQVNLELVAILVTSVVLVITAANAFAPKAAAGGHNYKILFYLSMTMGITGFLMLAIPSLAGSMFNSILNSTP